jgi:DNA repair protein RadC
LSIKIKELPISERPYEKLELYGEKALSDAELLAIIIKTGTKEETSVELAKRILGLNENINQNSLNFLREKSIQEFMQIKGIGRVKAIQLKALCEFATRLNKPFDYRKIKIQSPGDIVKLLVEDMKYLKTELLKLVILNNSNEILKIQNITEGNSNMVAADAKNILSEVIKMQAPKIILLHNHPSGNLRPSQSDIDFTKRIKQACEILGIQLLDHIIITENGYTSIFYEMKKII